MKTYGIDAILRVLTIATATLCAAAGVASAQGITVLSPNGGEVWEAGTQQTISCVLDDTWRHAHASDQTPSR